MIVLLAMLTASFVITVVLGIRAAIASRKQTRAQPHDVLHYGHFTNNDPRWGYRR